MTPTKLIHPTQYEPQTQEMNGKVCSNADINKAVSSSHPAKSLKQAQPITNGGYFTSEVSR
jgi:hypothetical protein